MERIPGNGQTRSDEGVWFESHQDMGTGNSRSGHAQKGATSKSPSVFMDQQLQSVLRDNDLDNRGDNYQWLKVHNRVSLFLIATPYKWISQKFNYYVFSKTWNIWFLTAQNCSISNNRLHDVICTTQDLLLIDKLKYHLTLFIYDIHLEQLSFHINSTVS